MEEDSGGGHREPEGSQSTEPIISGTESGKDDATAVERDNPGHRSREYSSRGFLCLCGST